MKTLLMAALIAGGVTPPVPVAGEITYSAIFMVRCGNAGGTAFYIGNGRIITAAHVTSHGPCSINGVPVETVREDGRNDVAELRGTISAPPLTLRCRSFRPGRYYRAVGYAQGMRMTLPLIATSHRSYDHSANGLRVLVGEVYPGMSGGPVLDARGRVVGATVRRWPAQARELRDTFVCRPNV